MSKIDIIAFDGTFERETPGFIEVESPPGTTIEFGEWVQRNGEYWVLRFDCPRWQPIDALPEGNELILAKSDLGGVMVWRADILRNAMLPTTPQHLRFPAVKWMEIPE